MSILIKSTVGHPRSLKYSLSVVIGTRMVSFAPVA